ncbi:MAG: hypothetical protein ACKOW2_01360 [Sphingobacteriaceae bacterium]
MATGVDLIIDEQMAEWQEECEQDKNKYRVRVLENGQVVIEVVEQ